MATIKSKLVNLPIVKSKLPKQWKPIRQALREEGKPWITTARLDEICSYEQNGRFSKADIFAILTTEDKTRRWQYKTADAQKILQLMAVNNFDICYPTTDNHDIAPQHLPDSAPPQYRWHKSSETPALQFRLKYPMMPKGSPTGERQIIIEVMGNPAYRKYALQKVRDEVEESHKKWFRSIKADEIIPCCCEECRKIDAPETYLLKDLLKLRANAKLRQCNTGIMVPIQQLLEGIYDSDEIEGFDDRHRRM